MRGGGGGGVLIVSCMSVVRRTKGPCIPTMPGRSGGRREASVANGRCEICGVSVHSCCNHSPGRRAVSSMYVLWKVAFFLR